MSQNNEPIDSSLRQQKLPACRPHFTLNKLSFTFIIFGILLIAFGIVVLITANNVSSITIPYSKDSSCSVGSSCTVPFTIDKPIKTPSYGYYILTNYYQNHRRYINSKSDDQLRGDTGLSADDLKSECEPLVSDASGLLNPCGLLPNSVFNDTFAVYDSGSNLMSTSRNDLIWESDLSKFKNSPGSSTDVTDPTFINWMRSGALPWFKKLHVRFDTDFNIGNYELRVVNNYPVSSFEGTKSFYITESSWVGPDSKFLGYLVLGSGIFALILGFVFLCYLKPASKINHSNL
eukprot:TRINITY_DN3250_c4_g1_i1.p1 TRINITY_DN3250_c4_g1~~TRINITY_DN3250_c4_g1_i1.p1  ORF type:complete len:290 (+),score=61.36 TRINITY_DN3250_c4_g1_i1:43-912(+)